MITPPSEPAEIGFADAVIGDGKVSSSPEIGSVYACKQEFRGGGAQDTRDWVVGDYSYTAEKLTVQVEVDWLNAQISFSDNNRRRVLTGNFPTDFYDPIYQIDRNPNPVMGRTIQLSLPLDPNLAATASCVSMGMVEIPLNRVVVYNALDDAERNARPMRSRTGALDIFRDRVSIITTAPALTRVRHINWCIR